MNDTAMTNSSRRPRRRHTRRHNAIASRNDDRILKLRMCLGMEGYAIYHMLVEKLYEMPGTAYPTCAYGVLAFDFRADEKLIRRVAEDFALFSVADGMLSLPDGTYDTVCTDNACTDNDDACTDDDTSDCCCEDISEDCSDDTSEKYCNGNNEDNSGNTTGKDDGNNTGNTYGDDAGNATANDAENSGLQCTEAKKEKENIPLHRLKEKDKEKERREKKRKSVAKSKTGKSGNSTKGADYEDSLSEEEITAFCTRFSNYWNKVLPATNSRLRPICIINAERRRRLAALRKNYTDNQIANFVYRAAISPYLNARTGKLPKPADLNWMLASDERIVKIIEGNM